MSFEVYPTLGSMCHPSCPAHEDQTTLSVSRLDGVWISNQLQKTDLQNRKPSIVAGLADI